MEEKTEETIMNENITHDNITQETILECDKESNINENEIQQKNKSHKKEAFIQFVLFALFSLSAGIIQFLTFECLYHWIGWNNWWATYLISLTLSVIWNFTFNRKFTFKSSSNIPVSMILVLLYYCAFTPISVFGGNALEGIGWNGTLVTVLMMLLNFATEFLFDKFVTFNDKVLNKFKFKKKQK